MVTRSGRRGPTVSGRDGAPRWVSWAVAGLLASQPALAQSRNPGGMPPPSSMSLAQSTAMRFPQPVVVGTLFGRPVLEPVESQVRLGTVRSVVRETDGTIAVVMQTEGLLGFGGRRIAVPVDAMVVLGQVMEVVALTPAQLRALPVFTGQGATEVDRASTIMVGLAKPSH